jgi:hypothetical protein
MATLQGAAAALALVFAGMVVATVSSHFKLMSAEKNGTRIWECLSCGKSIVAQGELKLKHHVAQVKGGGVTICPNPNPAMKDWFKKELDINKAPEAAPAATAKSAGTGPIEHHFGTPSKTEADQSVLNWLAFAKLPPFVTSSVFFRDMIDKTRAAGSSYTVPSRESLGLDRGKLGKVLQAGLDLAREGANRALRAVKFIKVRLFLWYF